MQNSMRERYTGMTKRFDTIHGAVNVTLTADGITIIFEPGQDKDPFKKTTIQISVADGAQLAPELFGNLRDFVQQQLEYLRMSSAQSTISVFVQRLKQNLAKIYEVTEEPSSEQAVPPTEG